MRKAPAVIHQYGRPTKAIDVDGHEIHKESEIYMDLYKQKFPVLDYDNHFVYRTDKVGSASIMCTCGSFAGVVGYRAYKQFSSYIGPEVVACIQHINTGYHSDGST